jgi:hypothetical protein
MAEASLSVLLRNGTHHGDGRAGQGTLFYALKCENITVNYGRTPIQIAIPQNKPELVDLGIIRPTVSISGLIDAVGGDPSNTTNGSASISTAGMASFNYTFNSDTITYFIPYKNALEDFIASELFTDDSPLEIQIGDPTQPISSGATESTGGAIYKVAVQSANFSHVPAMEDRYSFAIQFVATAAQHVTFPSS